MAKVSKQYRQGDVLLQPVAAIPEGAKPLTKKGPIILAEGEVTGHAHRITASQRQVRAFMAGADLYLEVKQPAEIKHEEHGTIAVQPGTYQVRRQIETWMDEVRQVAD